MTWGSTVLLASLVGLTACDIPVSSTAKKSSAATPESSTTDTRKFPRNTILLPPDDSTDRRTAAPTPTPSPSPSDRPLDEPFHDTDPPRSIASLGDSITAGALANLDRRTATSLGTLGILASEGFLQLFGKGSGNLAHDLEHPDLSWSTGDSSKLWTHARRLESLTGRALEIGNFAVSGSEASDVLDKEIPELQAWSRRMFNTDAPDYVTLLIGANDICAENAAGMTPTADYKARVQSIATTLLANSRTRMLISALPNIASLKAKAESARLLPPFYNQCRNLWETLNVCPTLTRSTGAERELVRQRVRDYNTALSEVVAELRASKGDRIRLATDTAEADYNQNHVSVDCFHPNPDGQQLLSDNTWSATWWAADYNAHHRYRE